MKITADNAETWMVAGIFGLIGAEIAKAVWNRYTARNDGVTI